MKVYYKYKPRCKGVSKSKFICIIHLTNKLNHNKIRKCEMNYELTFLSYCRFLSRSLFCYLTFITYISILFSYDFSWELESEIHYKSSLFCKPFPGPLQIIHFLFSYFLGIFLKQVWDTNKGNLKIAKTWPRLEM